MGNENSGSHQFRTYEPDGSQPWLAVVAKEYQALRTATEAPLSELSIDGIDVVDTSVVEACIRRATMPVRRKDNFDVVRSDFGETIGYMVLEHFDKTAIGYKGVRDRETVQQPDRGIDIVGVEDGPDAKQVLTLVLGEVKVSDDKKCPPGVVDTGKDALRKQHRGHMKNRVITARKIFNRARRLRDTDLRTKFLMAAYLLEHGKLDRLRIIACCVLVRSSGRFSPQDTGTFQTAPTDYKPAEVRFITVRTPEDIEGTIKKWYALLSTEAA